MIYTEVTRSSFIDEFLSWDTYSKNFSYEGLGLLYDYLDELSESENIELDVVAICCEFNEDSAENIAGYYNIDIDSLDEKEIFDTVLDYLESNTIVAGSFDNVIVYQGF